MRREEVFWPITEGLSLVTLRRAVITICNSQVRQRQGTSVKQLSNDYTFCLTRCTAVHFKLLNAHSYYTVFA